MKTYLIISFLVVNFYQLCQFQPLTPSKSYDLQIGEGDYAKSGQFPFAVVLAGVTPYQNYYKCTGAIIHESWVLMAADCFNQFYGDPTIFAGALYWQDGIRYNVTKWVAYPEWVHAGDTNDVGLAKIDGVFKFDQFIAPIEIGKPKADEAASIVGWGFVENLKYYHETIFSYDECSSLVINANVSLVPGSICSISSEEGDDYLTGAPLIQNGVLVGIFSHLLNNNVGIDGNATYYLDWIKQTIYEN